MKFVLVYTAVDGGSAAHREDAEKRAMQLLSKFEPSVEISMWVDRLDARGGFAMFETDDPAKILKDIALWAPLVNFELYPVMEVGESTPILQEAIDLRDSIT